MYYFKMTRNICLSVLIVLFSQNILASIRDPQVMLKNVITRTQSELKAKNLEIRKNPKILYKLVDTIILPIVDWDEAARWVVGRNAWHKNAGILLKDIE